MNNVSEFLRDLQEKGKPPETLPVHLQALWWAKKGDWILIGRYAGTRFKLEDDHEVRIINDDEVIATILNPDDIKSL